jgi:hypothetical protein
MRKTILSIVVYSIYLGTGGLGMAFIPNVMLHLLGLPPTNEVWVRLFGFLAIVLGAKGLNGAHLKLLPVMQFDVYTRVCFSLFLTTLIVLGLCPRIMFIFAAIDFAAAVWTYLSIRADKRAQVDAA